VAISPGELLDKISILKIKQERIADVDKLAHVNRELAELTSARDQHLAAEASLLDGLAGELKVVNEALWDIEDAIRDCEARAQFDHTFVALARSVYQTNDRRAAIKREINQRTRTPFAEVKAYASYHAAENR